MLRGRDVRCCRSCSSGRGWRWRRRCRGILGQRGMRKCNRDEKGDGNRGGTEAGAPAVSKRSYSFGAGVLKHRGLPDLGVRLSPLRPGSPAWPHCGERYNVTFSRRVFQAFKGGIGHSFYIRTMKNCCLFSIFGWRAQGGQVNIEHRGQTHRIHPASESRPGLGCAAGRV